MRFGRLSALFFVLACSSATWEDTFVGTDARSTNFTAVDAAPPDLDAFVGDAGSASPGACDQLAQSSPTVPITVTFPNHGTPAETIHVVASSASCDIDVDTDTDQVIFASDAIPCAKLLAAGTPESGTVQVSGGDSPNDMLFLWSYGDACTIDDDYSLSKQ